MAFTPENSAIRVTPEIEKELATANMEQVKEIMARAAVSQGLAVRDIYSPDVLLPTELANAAPREVGKVVVLNGVKHSLIAQNDADLIAQETALYRAALAQPASATQEQTRDGRGRFVEPHQDVLEKTEADLIDRALAAKGISIDALHEFSVQRDVQSWKAATESFRSAHPEWIGGEANVGLIGGIIADPENQEALAGMSHREKLEAAYQHAVQNDMLHENPVVTLNDEIASANSPEEIRRLLARDSSLFGR